jgi:FtsP/CotA-like multicopper oxidase with cupredoxin domain
MQPNRLAAVIGTAAITVAGLGAITACGSAGQAPSATVTPGAASPPAAAATPGGSAYDYYQSMMGRLYSGSTGSPGSMMGGSSSYGSMMGGTGYRWMMGGPDAPGWMQGQALPGFMMGTSHDPGQIMGTLFANAPGPQVTPAEAARLGSQIPGGATVSQAQHKITFSGSSVRLTIVASPSGGPDETFRVAGMVNPAIAVTPGARVSIQVINADPDTAHGLVVTASTATSSWMPMMTSHPAFPGSALWFLGSPTTAGMHAGTLIFTASTPGSYRYLCPVPAHAQKGMTGTFAVSPS